MHLSSGLRIHSSDLTGKRHLMFLGALQLTCVIGMTPSFVWVELFDRGSWICALCESRWLRGVAGFEALHEPRLNQDKIDGDKSYVRFSLPPKG